MVYRMQGTLREYYVWRRARTVGEQVVALCGQTLRGESASVLSLTLRYNTAFRRWGLAARNTRAFPIMAHCQTISETGH
jgi:hypothetical protein